MGLVKEIRISSSDKDVDVLKVFIGRKDLWRFLVFETPLSSEDVAIAGLSIVSSFKRKDPRLLVGSLGFFKDLGAIGYDMWFLFKHSASVTDFVDLILFLIDHIGSENPSDNIFSLLDGNSISTVRVSLRVSLGLLRSEYDVRREGTDIILSRRG